MNIIVHIHEGVDKYGYEMGTRQAWKCSEKAKDVKRVIGVIKGKVACVIEGGRAELSTPENNTHHEESIDGRYIFLGGHCWHEKDIFAHDMPSIMYKKVKDLNQGHSYLSDNELETLLS